MPQETIELDFDFVHASNDAILVCDDILQGDDATETWIPKSQIHNIDDFDELQPGQSYSFEVSVWFAQDEGLI